MGVVVEIRRHLGVIKERVLEKLAASSVPADALDNARHFLETAVKDVTLAAHGLTKDTLNRIKTRLVDILPSLSPAITTKMVDDAAKEANGEGDEEDNLQKQEHDRQSSSKAPYASPASSLFASLKQSSRL
ncbi:hypothetical protein Tsubulata_006333 [Turnera subulata]|uniref:Uncharacterized protein n=1 Tax=Turnera subulata TaxID=218843 RepID=A0A9Q0G6U0_9ROSI|nr:hypothetical protein Tsubulata_006333 [Turnera subulata]